MFNDDKMWAVMREPDVIDPNSDFGKYYVRFDSATPLINSKGVKYRLFCTSLKKPTDAIYTVLNEGDVLTVPYEEIKAHLTGFTQSAIIHQSLASALYKAFVPIAEDI